MISKNTLQIMNVKEHKLLWIFESLSNLSMKLLHHSLRFVKGGVVSFTAFFLCVSSGFTHADVYFDMEETLASKTDAIVDVLSSSVVPGGVRRISINGSKMLVRRFANPAGDDSAFYSVWNDVKQSKTDSLQDILTVTNEYDPNIAALLNEDLKDKPLEDWSPLLKDSTLFAFNQAIRLKNKVADSIETAFGYETSQHRIIASVPIKALDAQSRLARLDSEDGYLFLSEKTSGTTVSSAFWQLQFDSEFNLLDMIGATDGDVKGIDTSVKRYPGSKMTMTFSEDTNGWRSKSWSYESKGDVLNHISHYADAMSNEGFKRESNLILENDYALLQFSSAQQEATVFVELLDPSNQSIQVTLQMRGG